MGKTRLYAVLSQHVQHAACVETAMRTDDQLLLFSFTKRETRVPTQEQGTRHIGLSPLLETL